MRTKLKRTAFILFCLFTSARTWAQDNWIGLQLPVDVKEFAGRPFRYTLSLKTDGSPAVLALAGAQVTRSDGQWGYFNNGSDQAVWEPAWTMRTIEGTLDSNAVTLNVGLVCMGNGTCAYDAAQVQVQNRNGQWQSLRLSNAGFEGTKLVNNLPEHWQISKPAPNFSIALASSNAYEGSSALTITGMGNEESGAIQFLKGTSLARALYNKQEFQIPMRDGVKLFTAVYTPKDASDTKQYPIMINRTPYSVGPYGADRYPFALGPSETMVQQGYIFVHQDVRGRYMSEGVWENMTPHLANKKSKSDVDESTDSWDTIDWLTKNVKYQNGKVGMWGISYPGFYASAGSIDAHPALKAVSPQAPVADFFFDDFHHNGAFTQAYFWNFPLFGTYKNKPTAEDWFQYFDRNTEDSYTFYRGKTLKELGDKYYKNNFLWQQMISHPNYDTFWQKRRIVSQLRNLKPAYLVVGGWFDAEDLYGALTTYKEIEKTNNGIYNTIVMGPFGHGDWAREDGHHMHHQIYFGDSIATFYQRNIEARFFQHFLKEDGDTATGLPEAYMFNTGTKEWQTFAEWPSEKVQKQKWYLGSGESLSFKPSTGIAFSEYVSDPAKPVPYTMDLSNSFNITPRAYMSEDQRFASRRPDVVFFQTDTLTEDLTLGGEITVKLNVSTTGTDADWVVKLVDVYPDAEQNTPYTPKGVSLSGYQQLVRSEAMRSRWRNSFQKPEPLTPNKVTPITFKLQDVLHTFKRGHRVMVQVQSTWFPLIDINPQTFVPNIYNASKSDFKKATQRVYHSTAAPSYLEVDVLK